MTDQTLVCPRCDYENIILTCGFCIECGNDLSELVSNLATTADIARSVAEHTSKSTPNSTLLTMATPPASTEPEITRLEDLVVTAGEQLGATPIPSSNGWSVKIFTTGERSQKVHILRSSVGNNNELLSFLSICGDASAQHAMTLLDWNSRLTGCAFAVRKINGQAMFVLTANWPRKVADVSLMVETIATIASKADQVEAKLSLTDRY